MRYNSLTPPAAQDDLNQQLALALHDQRYRQGYGQGFGAPALPTPTPGAYAGGTGPWGAPMGAGPGDALYGASVGDPSGVGLDQAPDLSALGLRPGIGAPASAVQGDGEAQPQPQPQLQLIAARSTQVAPPRQASCLRRFDAAHPPSNLPQGWRAVDIGGGRVDVYMQNDTTGEVRMTPDYAAYQSNPHKLDVIGAGEDLANIAGGGASGALAGVPGVIGSVLGAGASTLKELHGSPNGCF